MNYAGKFEALFSDGRGAPESARGPAHPVHAHAPADAILVPDAHLLFNGDFKRSGLDLILTDHDRDLVLHDYFKGETHLPLASPDGAYLTGDLVNALTGSVQLSQAGAAPSAAEVIGHVTKLQGTATCIRNGVSIILHMGDNVEKGDVVQSGADSTLGITFIDGTVFGLASNARMVLNEMVYDPNGSNNSTLFSIVAGTISFVAGNTAKHGDMKIDTPVATMGIRGTAVLVEIDFTVPGQNAAPNAKFQVLVEPDGSTGSYILYDKTTLQPIAVVNQAGTQINISQGVVSQSQNPLSPEIQKLINDVFTLKFTDNSNPKTTVTQNDSVTPQFGPTFKTAGDFTATPIFLNVPSNGSSSSSGNPNAQLLLQHIPGTLNAVMLDASGHLATNFGLTERVGRTGDAADSDSISASVNFVDLNAGDRPTVKVNFSSFSYHGATQGLNAQQLADIAATEVNLSLVPGAGNDNNGSATLTYSIPDKAFDFLAAGETLTLTYVAEVDSNFAPGNESKLIPFTITITGTNDAPVITTGPQSIAFSGGTKTAGGPLTTDNPTSGTLSFSDADLTDTHKVSAALDAKSVTLDGKPFDLQDLEPTPFKILNAALSAQLAADSTGSGKGSVTWTLADLPAYVADFIPKGETLTLTYQVTVTDSQGATSTQDVTVNITGTEPAAEVWISSGGEGQDQNWSNGTNWETGNVPAASDDVIIITDQLHGLTPSFPVTIEAGVQAQAKSLVMNDFDNSPPELDNLGALTIGGGATLNADSILKNFGAITLGGLAEILNEAVLNNSGTIILDQGGDFKDTSHITNTGTIEVKAGTLNVSVDIANSDDSDGWGLIQVDTGATLVFDPPGGAGATISGGSLAINGTLDLGGATFLTQGTLTNDATVNVAVGSTAVFDGETVNNQSLIDISGALTLEHATAVTNLLATAVVKVEAGATLTLLDTSGIVHGELDNSGTVHVDDASGALLDGVDVENAASAAIMVDAGGSDVPSTLVVDHGTTIDGGTLVVGPYGTLDVSTSGATLSGGIAVDNSGLIQVDQGATLALSGATVDGGKITDLGTIHVTADSAISDAVACGNVTVDADTTLKLDGTTFSGGTFAVSGTLETAGSSAIHDAEIADGGLLQVNSGSLVVDGALSGQATIVGCALLELASCMPDAYSCATITFAAGANATLQLDHAETFGGTVTNFDDDDKIDLSDFAFGTGTTVSYCDGVLKVVDGTQVAHIALSGDYSGDNFVAVADGHGGTIIEEIPGAIVSGLTNGSSVEGQAVTVAITDGGNGVTGAQYQWQLDGNTIDGVTGASFTPTEGDEGHALSVQVTFTDAQNVIDATTVSAGVVQESPTEHATVTLAGLDGGNAVEGQQVTAGVTNGDAPALGDIVFTWKAGDATVASGAGLDTYTPKEADEGQPLTVSVSFTDSHGNAESGSASAGVVQESPTEHATVTLAGLVDGSPFDGQTVSADVAGPDAPSSGIVYTWTVGDTVVLSGAGDNAYKPTEADEGKVLSVAVSFTDTQGLQESGSVSAGIVIGNDDDGALPVHHAAPVIDTSNVQVSQNDNGSMTISGLNAVDSDPLALLSPFKLSATTDSGAVVSPGSDSGSIAKIESDLSQGITYTPGAHPPSTDTIALTVTDAFGDSDTVHFVFNEAATPAHGGAVALQGTPGNDVIFGTGHNDVLAGNGGQDQFVFQPTSGHDPVQHTITDFDVVQDKIDLRAFSAIDASSVGNWLAQNATQTDQGTKLTLDGHDTILLNGVSVHSLHVSDFIVSPHVGNGTS